MKKIKIFDLSVNRPKYKVVDKVPDTGEQILIAPNKRRTVKAVIQNDAAQKIQFEDSDALVFTK